MKILPIFVFLTICLILISGCSAPQATTHTSTMPIPSQSLTPTHTSTTITLTQNVATTTPSSTNIPLTQTVIQSQIPISSSGKMTVSFIDVGQGDSELIQSPSGKVMLIDAGPTDAGSKVVKYLQDRGISTIDVVVVTHPHEDHIGGMAAVLNTFTVKQFIDSGYPHTTSTYENMLNHIDKKNIPFKTVKSGDTISLDPVISIAVLNPQATFSNDINENSVVMKITNGKTTFLFTGDAEKIAPHADILKVPHHGSDTGSWTVAQIAPSVAIIEVGAGNSYGHPTASTLQRLQQAGAAIYRTDLDGNIKITSDGSTYSVEKEKQATVTAAPIKTTASTITVPTTSGGVAVCDCSSNKYNCADFSTQASAQACYNYCLTQGKGDIHGLDADKNGKACESNK